MAEHWDEAYAQGEATRSWFATEPVLSLRMLDAAGVSPDARVVDVGGGTSRLVDSLQVVVEHERRVARERRQDGRDPPGEHGLAQAGAHTP